MKILKRVLACALILGTALSFCPKNVSACNQTQGCYATNTNVSCGYVQGNVGAYHTITEANGYTTYCSITYVSGSHTISCAGCGKILSTEYRTCSEGHSYYRCEDRYGLCK